MRYEIRIGWRYLYGGKRDRLMLSFAGFAALVTIAGLAVLVMSKGENPAGVLMFVVGLMVVIGAWFKRYLIVTPTLLNPFLPMQDVPERYHHYFPSWQEWAITMGSLAGALLIITLFARIFPIIPIQETITERHETAV